jgi:hypothetical protein
LLTLVFAAGLSLAIAKPKPRPKRDSDDEADERLNRHLNGAPWCTVT